MTTVRELITSLADRFASAGLSFGHGTDNAWDEAVNLVLTVTGLADDRALLEVSVPAEALEKVEALARRRIEERIPLAYLLGRARFAGLEFLVTPGVVIPRSPIGGLLDNSFAPWLRESPSRIVDMCCGTGCIGIAAASKFPGAEVLLVDVDSSAVTLARENVALHDLGHRVTVWESDLFAQLPEGRFDLIISNPPYVDQADMNTLPPEYRHEPAAGLAAGLDGLAIMDRLLESLGERLVPGGLFVGEVGASAPALVRKYPALPFTWVDLPEGGEGVFVLELA